MTNLDFPILDANLLTPEIGRSGSIAICTNYLSPTEVYEEIPNDLRQHICVLGSLVVNRDGAERMIVNSLAHPTLRYLILFGEEANTFQPSTNLLQALQFGYQEGREGNYIKNGRGAAPQYPNVSSAHLEKFRQKVVVLPIYKHGNPSEIWQSYGKWLQSRIDPSLFAKLTDIQAAKKIYYDHLADLIKTISGLADKDWERVTVDPAEFKHLQPPKVYLESQEYRQVTMPFSISRQGDLVRVDLDVFDDTKLYQLGNNPFDMACSIMEKLGPLADKLFSPAQQLFLGCELGRVAMEIATGIEMPPLTQPKDDFATGDTEILTSKNLKLVPDPQYYYKIAAREDGVSVQCLSNNPKEDAFDLRSRDLLAMLFKLDGLGRFSDYEQAFLHRVDIGIEMSKAFIAAKHGYCYIQDFSSIFKINTEKNPFLLVEGANFLDVHKKLVTRLFSEGITEQHADKKKGQMRGAVTLSIFRDAGNALKQMPSLYQQGGQSTEQMRLEYQQQLLRFDHDGSYSYGHRTRTHFGKDQLEEVIKHLRENPKGTGIIQRFDCLEDMQLFYEDKHLEASHDPCLTHDLFFIDDGKLHSFHIARAHNIINGYPENIFGLHDAYDQHIADELGVSMGDMYMLSSRANILLLTESQRAAAIMSEPSCSADSVDQSSGPWLFANLPEGGEKVVAYLRQNLDIDEGRVVLLHQDCGGQARLGFQEEIHNLENFHGQNLIEKAIDYLRKRGANHNNPIISAYDCRHMGMDFSGLLFWQANVYGGKLYATAVFTNRTKDNIADDVKLCNYLGARYSEAIGYPPGELVLFYAPFICTKN